MRYAIQVYTIRHTTPAVDEQRLFIAFGPQILERPLILHLLFIKMGGIRPCTMIARAKSKMDRLCAVEQLECGDKASGKEKQGNIGCHFANTFV